MDRRLYVVQLTGDRATWRMSSLLGNYVTPVISRTLAYAIVTGVLAGVYAGLVLLATQVFLVHAPVAVAAATLAAAALFSPLRRRVQRRVDRRFNRARYDADQTVAAFAARLKDAVDLDTVREDLARVVQAALEPAHVSVWTSRRRLERTCPHRASLESPEPPRVTFASTGGGSRRLSSARPRGGTGQAAHRVIPRVAIRIRVPPARPPRALCRRGRRRALCQLR